MPGELNSQLRRRAEDEETWEDIGNCAGCNEKVLSGPHFSFSDVCPKMLSVAHNDIESSHGGPVHRPSEHRPAEPRPSDRRVQTACLVILTLISVGVAMYFLQPVLVPFVLALFFSQCLSPVIHFLMRRFKFPQVVAVSTAVLFGLALLAGSGLLIAASVGGKVTSKDFVETFQTRLDTLLRRAVDSKPAHYLGVRDEAGIAQFKSAIQTPAINFVQNTLTETRDFILRSATVLLLMAFLLYGRRWEPPGGASRPGILVEIEDRVQRYISLTVFISLLTGVLVGSALSILGVEFAAVFGLLAFLLNFIPNLGAVIATLLPIPLVFLDPNIGIITAILAIAIPAAIQILIGSLLQPKMLGNSLELHPVVLLLALLFFAMIWGVGGAFLATPLTAVFKIVFEKIPATRPLAAALAGNLGPLTRTIDAEERR
jgi:AI-2 transport protein TqsA